jgi:hypothetical protein
LPWVKDVEPEEIACCCLEAIGTLGESSHLLALEPKWNDEIEAILAHLCKNVLLPVLQAQSSHSARSYQGMTKLVTKTCSLMCILATSSPSLQEDSSFLLSCLGPLDVLQKGNVDLSNELSSTIIAACLNSLARVIEHGTTSTALVKAMISVVHSLSVRENKVTDTVRLGYQELLKQCVTHESVSVSEHSLIALSLAKARDWGTWSVIVKVKDGIAAEKSLIEVEQTLLNPSYVGEQLTVLAAIRGLIQSSPPPNLLVGRVVAALGAEILSVFQAHGTLANSSKEMQSHRATACADCLKIALAAYQQFSADGTEEDVSQYLMVLFEAFIAVIRFNGLPNHPPPQGSFSDVSIGRMCAQAITHVARTTPIPFKSCVSTMVDVDRAVLEFAVRAEMTGYATVTSTASAAAPVKKKLNLQGFKKQ